MAARPREILIFPGRGTSARDYHRLKAALDRLQSTTIATSLRQISERRMHRFSWINEWTERADAHGNADGIDLIVPDWFYRAVLDDALVLTIDRRYFALTGGMERWLYRVVRKPPGRPSHGCRFEFRHLHAKSACLSPFKRFAFELREIVRRQPLPGYRLLIEHDGRGQELLALRLQIILWVTAVERACYRERKGTCHQEPTPRAIRNPHDRIHQAKQRLLARLTQSLTYMNLTLLKLGAPGTGENSGAVRHDCDALPSGHAHPYRIDLA